MTYTITKKNQIFQYKDDQVIQKDRRTELKRKTLTLQIIELNPKIPHTHLITMLLHYGKSKSKKTYEKLLNKLEKEGIITSEKMGTYPNAPRLWEMPTDDALYEKQFNEKMTSSFAMRKKQLDNVKLVLPTLSELDKALMLCTLLKSNHEKFLTTKWLAKYNMVRKQNKESPEFVNMNKHLQHLTEYENSLYDLIFQHPNCIRFVHVVLDSFQNTTQEMLLNMAEGFPTNNNSKIVTD